MTVKNDFSIESNFATWYFSENAPPGNRKIVLNRDFVLVVSPAAVGPGLAWARSARRARLHHCFGGSSRQAGSLWSTRSGASRDDSANAGSCQSWFNSGSPRPLLGQDWQRLISALAGTPPSSSFTVRPNTGQSGATGIPKPSTRGSARTNPRTSKQLPATSARRSNLRRTHFIGKQPYRLRSQPSQGFPIALPLSEKPA